VEQSNALLESLDGADREAPATQRALATNLWTISNFEVGRNRLDEANEFRRRAVVIYEALHRRYPQNLTENRNLSIGYKGYGATLQVRGERQLARELYEKAATLDELRLKTNPSHPEWQLDLSYAIASLASLDLSAGDTASALERYRQALRLREAVMSADPSNVQAASVTSRAHRTIAQSLEQQNDLSSALEHARQALAIEERLARMQPSNNQLAVGAVGAHAYAGSVVLRMAERSQPGTEASRKLWTEARDHFAVVAAWLREHKGTTPPPSNLDPTAVEKALARAEAELAKRGRS
jgi:tetratricopeptide (TPR) repeat protein